MSELDIMEPFSGNFYGTATNIVPVSMPSGVLNADAIRKRTAPDTIDPYLTDEAQFPGGHSTELIQFLGGTTTLEVSTVLVESADDNRTVVAQGARTSLTGATVPNGDTIFDMSHLTEQSEAIRYGDHYYVNVQPGVTLSDLQQQLNKKGLFFPAAPTYTEATVVGAISTNAAGARSYKYGGIRNYVEALKVVLPTGELLSIQRGQYKASEEDTDRGTVGFSLENEAGGIRHIPSAPYKLPDVPKVSAGYYAEPGMDLVDLFIGSEGTLGVIVEATIKAIPEPQTYMALVRCESDKQAFKLITRLRNQEPEKRETLKPGGISAVEYIGSDAVDLVRHKNGAQLIQGAQALLLVQIEKAPLQDDESLMGFIEICEDAQIDTDTIALAQPEDSAMKEDFVGLRESVPIAINEQVSHERRTFPEITKMGADPCVRPEDLAKMVMIYAEEYGRVGLRYYAWGHGEGNLHFNVLPTSAEQVELAKQAILSAGTRVIIELEGTGTAEHGIGKNPVKQELLQIQYGEAGVDAMRAIKRAIDPKGVMAPGNIFHA